MQHCRCRHGRDAKGQHLCAEGQLSHSVPLTNQKHFPPIVSNKQWNPYISVKSQTSSYTWKCHLASAFVANPSILQTFCTVPQAPSQIQVVATAPLRRVKLFLITPAIPELSDPSAAASAFFLQLGPHCYRTQVSVWYHRHCVDTSSSPMSSS